MRRVFLLFVIAVIATVVILRGIVRSRLRSRVIRRIIRRRAIIGRAAMRGTIVAFGFLFVRLRRTVQLHKDHVDPYFFYLS